MEQERKRGRPSAGERAERKQRILDLAIRLFGDHGFAGTSLDALADQAGVTKRTIYAYFTDKEGLFTAAVDRQHAYLAQALEPQTSLAEAAARIVESLHSDEAVTLHRMVIAEAHRLPGLAAAFYRHGPQRSISFLAALMERTPAPAPQGAAEALYALLLGEAHRRRLLGLAPAPDREQARAHARRALALVCPDAG